MNPVDRLRSWYACVKRLAFPRPYPRNAGGRACIHLGCGAIDSPEFINVDIARAPHIHHVRDVRDLSVFRDEFADIVYACHVLEHISFRETRQVLAEWRRVLKPGGVLRLSVPDLDKLVVIYSENNRSIESICPMLMGHQDSESNRHQSVFNYDYLGGLLRDVGFRTVRTWDPNQAENHAFDDWASREIEFGDKSFSVSLNIEGVK